MSDLRAGVAKILQSPGFICATLSFFYFIFLASRLPAAPILTPDSQSYIDFYAIRTAGYPFFLHLTGLAQAGLVQSILVALALGYLGLEMAMASRSRLVAVGLMGSIAVNQPLNAYHSQIMTESLFVTFLMLVLGLLLRVSRTRSLGAAALLSLIAGVMIVVRPAGWFLFPVLVLAGFLLHPGATLRFRLALLGCLCLPFLGVTQGERAYHHARFAPPAASILTIALYGKAGLMATDPPALATEEARALSEGFAPVRTLLAEVPDFSTRAFLRVNYETCLEYACASSLGISTAGPAARAAALERIQAAPLAFLGLAVENYAIALTLYHASHPGDVEATRAFLAAHRPLPFGPFVSVFDEEIVPARAAWVLRPAVWALAGLAAAIAVAGLWRVARGRRLAPLAAVAVLAGVGVHAGVALVALTGVGIPRYLLGLWPLMMLAPACAAASLRPSLQEWLLSLPRSGPRSGPRKDEKR